MEIETTICPKCHRQGCFTEDVEPSHKQNAEAYSDEILHDYTCKCGHTISEQEYINPILTDAEERWLDNLRRTEGPNSSTVALIENLIARLKESTNV